MMYKFLTVFLITLLTVVLNASKSDAGNMLIEMTSNDAFSIEIAHINLGQTITWLPSVDGHNIEFAKGPDGVNLPEKSEISKAVSIKFTQTGVYLYWCSPHKDTGMLGLVVVERDLSNLSEIAKVSISRQSNSVLAALVNSLHK